MRIIGTHHVGISTPDLDRLLEFYVDVLGLRPDGGFPDQNIAFVDAGTTLVELVGETAGNTDCRKSGWNHLALEVQDVDAAFAKLSARGIAFDVSPEDFPPNDPKFRIAFLHDPDGNQIELIQAV